MIEQLKTLAGRFAGASVVIAVFSAVTWGQTYSGSLTGVVTDPDKAIIPGANVALTDVGKGYVFSTTTDGNGRYVIRNLVPGTYRLNVNAQGFGLWVRDNIALNVNQSASVDVEMQLEKVAQTVEVKTEAALLATQDAVLGESIDRKFVNDLPLVGRSVLNLTYLAPGVTQAAGAAYGSGGDVNFISNGGRNSTASVITDGVATTGPDPNTGIVRALYVPSVDAVQEFKVEQNNFRADIGFSGATAINVVTRSGSNQFHGTLYEFGRSSALNANNFFSNRNGVKKPMTNNNIFGGVVGGPIKKDRTFFFAVYNGSTSRNSMSTSAGVPSAAMRTGDFGEICKAGFDSAGMCADANAQLWDPYTGVYDASRGGPVRQSYIPFNNLATYMSPGPPAGTGSGISLPRTAGNLIDPAAAKMMQYFPLPNVNVGLPSYNRFNNYFANTLGRSRGNELNGRIDHRFTDRDLFVAKYAHGWSNSTPAKCFDSIMDPCSNGPSTTTTDHLALNFNRTMSPTTVATLNIGFARQMNISPGAPGQYPDFSPIEDLGLPKYMLMSGKTAAPYASYGGGYVLGALGTKTWSIWTMDFQNYQLAPSVDMIRGRHDLKAGGEVRVHRFHFFQPGVPTGSFSYSPYYTSRYPNSGGGDGIASLLVGIGSGNYLVNSAISTQSVDYAFYIHDQWRLTDRLTVNLGLRYEVAVPQTERYNRIDWFDPSAASPLQVPGVGPLRGGMRFADDSTRTPLDTAWNNWGPRIALAYKFQEKTVLRVGYGIFYSVSMGNASGITGGPFQAWNQTTNVQVYAANGGTPYARLSDPFPSGGPLDVPGNKKGLLTMTGLNLDGPRRDWNKIPQTQTWSFGFQRELPAQMVLTANYLGNKGTHLYFGTGEQNMLGTWVEGLGAQDVAGLVSYVANPFYGVITDPNSGMRYSTIQAYNLLRPYPQFTSVTTTIVPWADSTYHALQIQLDKRFSHGVQVQSAYTWSKSIDNSSVVSGNTAYLGGGTSLQNPNKRFLERSLSQYDVPQSLKIGYTYDLPWGRNRLIGKNWNRWLDGIIGGWETTGIWLFQSGFPIGLGLQGGQSLPTYGGQRANLVDTLRRNDGATWMTQYFANPGAAVLPPRYAVGNAPRTLPVRIPGTNNATMAVFKQIPISVLREGSKLEVRVEAFNALNRPQFGGPNATVNSPSFGLVTSQANSPRTVQLGMKLYW